MRDFFTPDRIITIVISGLLAGVVGFFTALRTVDDELAELRERTAKLEEANKIANEYRKKTDTNVTGLLNLKRDLEDVERDVEEIEKTALSVSLLRSLLDERTAEHQRETVRELSDLLQDHK